MQCVAETHQILIPLQYRAHCHSKDILSQENATTDRIHHPFVQ